MFAAAAYAGCDVDARVPNRKKKQNEAKYEKAKTRAKTLAASNYRQTSTITKCSAFCK